jgi:hypothetical protein
MPTRQSGWKPAPYQLNPQPMMLSLLPGMKMHPEEHDEKGNVKHSKYCMRTPKRYDWGCHRCVQLMQGAAPRKGWQRDFFARKLGQLYLRF